MSDNIVFNENFITRAIKLKIRSGRRKKNSLKNPVSNIV